MIQGLHHLHPQLRPWVELPYLARDFFRLFLYLLATWDDLRLYVESFNQEASDLPFNFYYKYERVSRDFQSHYIIIL